MVKALAQIRERREELDRNPDHVWDVLSTGNRAARERAAETLAMVRDAMKLSYSKLT